MRTEVTYTLVTALVIVAAGVLANNAIERRRTLREPRVPMRADIPSSIRIEHEEIHDALVAATRRDDAVGAAARELAAVLDPHFEREEQVALPPLGALGPIAMGAPVQNAGSIRAMSDTLRHELPQMLAEHTRIRTAVEALRSVAVSANAPDVVALADQLALHALTEEQVLYPAAIVAGDMLHR